MLQLRNKPMPDEIELKFDELNFDFNYAERMGCFVEIKKFIRQQFNKKVYETIYCSWIDMDGDKWIMVREFTDSGMNNYRRILRKNIHQQCVIKKIKKEG